MKAQQDAEKQAAAVLADANKEIAELAILATEQVLGRELADRREQERFVQEFLASYRGQRVMSDKAAKAERYAQAAFQALIERWQTSFAQVLEALVQRPGALLVADGRQPRLCGARACAGAGDARWTRRRSLSI